MKKFEIIFTMNDDGAISISGENNGFTALEAIALLEMKKSDVLDQVNKPTKFARTYSQDGTVLNISDKGE